MIAQLTNTFIMPTILKVFIVLHIQSYFADHLVNNPPVSTKLNQFILYSCLTHSSHFRSKPRQASRDCAAVGI